MNFERIGLLLHVEEGTRGHPGLKSIHDKVLAELHEHAADLTKEDKPVKEAKQEEIKQSEEAQRSVTTQDLRRL